MAFVFVGGRIPGVYAVSDFREGHCFVELSHEFRSYSGGGFGESSEL